MDWSLIHLEGLKDMCKHQIEISLPLPHEILFDASFMSHESHTNFDASNHSGTLLNAAPVQNVSAHEFLDLVEKLSCLNECSGHGSCVNGNCLFITWYLKSIEEKLLA